VEALIEIKRLKKHYPILSGILQRTSGAVRAVDDVSLVIHKGQWLGLVGESGCGKTTLGKTIIHLIPPTSGHIYMSVPQEIKDEIDRLEKSPRKDGHLEELLKTYDVSTFTGGRLKALRRKMQLVHQDPCTSLNPRMKVKEIVGEPLAVHKIIPRREIRQRVTEMLEMVGLSEKHLSRYPHQFSGGQRQRIAIARALVTNPDFIVFDEPTSALDVSVQAQILTLLKRLKKEKNLTYLYITHNLNVAESVCDSISVMYLGKIVEIGSPIEIFRAPRHPYTRALVFSTPVPDPTRKRGRMVLPGEVPSPANPPPGCPFHPRCDHALDICRQSMPTLEVDEQGRFFACWNPIK